MFERLWRDDPYKLTKCCASELKHQYRYMLNAFWIRSLKYFVLLIQFRLRFKFRFVRMNDLIMRWPSSRFYQGKLIAAPSVANCSLSDLDSVTETQETREVLCLIDTAKITGNKYEGRNNNKSLRT